MCILFAEDEPLIHMIAVEGLQEAGLEVAEAATGDQALDLIQTSDHQFTALVTDFHMPGADGSEVAAAMRKAWPHIPVIIATGRPDCFQPQWNDRLGYHLLVKPYTSRQLVDVVHTMLEKTNPGKFA